MSHTKGQWKVVRGAWGEVESIRAEEWGSDLMGDYRGVLVCDFGESRGNRKHSYEEAEANANLIAAAPELLETAEKALSYMRLHKYADKAWADDLESAINKARGA